MKTFREYVVERDMQETLRTVNYKPGAIVPGTIRAGGPEKMNPLGVVNPSRPAKPKPYMPIFRMGKGTSQRSTVVGK
jgi:hypothetical protein